MHTSPLIPQELREAARGIIIREQVASVSLLQRHFHVDVSDAQDLMQVLQFDGVVCAQDAMGMRQLTSRYQDGSADFRAWALSEFAGCDGGDARGRVWVLGAEHGDSPSDGPAEKVEDDGYSIERQGAYRYNRQVFKLLAAIEGLNVTDWPLFAEREQPFVRHSRGYFKGNLYPYPCRKEVEWDDAAKRETGFSTKERYRAWCRNHRFVVLARWIAAANPEFIVASGITHRHDFVCVAFSGAPVELREHRINVGGRSPRFFSANSGGRLLVVLPHLSGSRLFGAHATLQAAGKQIADLKREALARNMQRNQADNARPA